MRRYLLDLCYLTLVPVYAATRLVNGKMKTDWSGRFGHVESKHVSPSATSDHAAHPCILIHAVSVGEVNATLLFIQALQENNSEVRIVLATTTDTGFARAKTCFEETDVRVVRYPIDFSRAVSRFLDAIMPNVVVLIEQEIWPNFTAECERRYIPVGVINARLSDRSARRYRTFGWLLARSLKRLSFVAAQTQEYADRFIHVGVPADRVHVTDTMKWDVIQLRDASNEPEVVALANDLGIDRERPLIVAGSTEPIEHALLHSAVPSDVQLLCAPRKPEWFDNAARDLPGCTRRSEKTGQVRFSQSPDTPTSRFLLDTLGELEAAYALADIAIVGRSFGELYGSNPIEPIALGKPTIIGPNVDDFRDVVDGLVEAGGLLQVTRNSFEQQLLELLHDENKRKTLAHNGQSYIRSRQGASQRNATLVLQHLESTSPTNA